MPSSHQNDPGFNKLHIFGAGGSGRETAWLAEQAWGNKVSIEFVVDQPEYLKAELNGRVTRLLTSLGPDESARFVVAVGSPTSRYRIAALCRAKFLRETSVVHPRVELSHWITIGEGSIICAGVVATTNISIGKHVHCNINCTISHDVRIGDYTTLSPGVHVSGHVHIGQGVFVGTGANIINGSETSPLIIGDYAIIAAGACVTKSVDARAMVAGVPAVVKR